MKGSSNDAEPNDRFHEHSNAPHELFVRDSLCMILRCVQLAAGFVTPIMPIFEKVSSMSNISLPTRRGTPVMRDVTSPNLNNMSASKRNLTDAAGLVVMASSDMTKRYWHADVVLG